jgi:hypothetical protein
MTPIVDRRLGRESTTTPRSSALSTLRRSGDRMIAVSFKARTAGRLTPAALMWFRQRPGLGRPPAKGLIHAYPLFRSSTTNRAQSLAARRSTELHRLRRQRLIVEAAMGRRPSLRSWKWAAPWWRDGRKGMRRLLRQAAHKSLMVESTQRWVGGAMPTQSEETLQCPPHIKRLGPVNAPQAVCHEPAQDSSVRPRRAR